MSVIPFRRSAGSVDVGAAFGRNAIVGGAQGADSGATMLVMFSEAEHLMLGLLMNRRNADDTHVFKDCQLQANGHAVSLALRFHADEAPFMAVDKVKRDGNREGYDYILRQEECAPVLRDNLRDIYQCARDRISLMLGEPLFDQPEAAAPEQGAQIVPLRQP